MTAGRSSGVFPLSVAQPLVAVIIPALNEAGKIGRVLDKMPRDARFEAIVVDDGSTDGTGEEARAHGAAVVIRHDVRRGVGAAIRDGWAAALERQRPYVALISGDDQHEPAELVRALETLLATGADYAQGSRWIRGGRVVGPTGGRGLGTRIYSAAFSILALRRVTDATNGFRIFSARILADPGLDLDQEWLTSYDLEPYVLYKTIRRGYAVVEVPCTVRYHAGEGYTKMRGLRDWWRLFRPAVLLRFGGEAVTFSTDRALGGRRILVTGGAGFIGGAVVNRLVAMGARVTVLDDLFTGQAETIPAGAQFVEGSVTDEKLVRELVAQHSLVFHMAARNIIASTKNPRDDYETNIGGTLNVLMAARESRPDRVVYTSSTSVYGNPRSIPINEDDGLVLLSPYAVSKLGGENYCTAFYESYGLPVAVVRYSNVYGPGQRPENPYCGVVSKFFASAIAGKPVARPRGRRADARLHVRGGRC